MTLAIDIASKTYPQADGGPAVTALAALRFEVPDGQLLCIVGPSGCGKTTLLQVVSGLDRNVVGTVRIAGRPPDETPAPGYVFQSPRLMPWLTVLDNVRLVAGSSAAQTRRADVLIEAVGLKSFRKAYPRELSMGMQRRVALARAFVNRPNLLLLDEPFVSLDAPTAAGLRRLLLDLWADTRATVLFVTHDLREAVTMGERLLLMTPRPGRIAADVPIGLSWPRDPHGAAVEGLRQRLLDKYPELLRALDHQTAETSTEGSPP